MSNSNEFFEFIRDVPPEKQERTEDSVLRKITDLDAEIAVILPVRPLFEGHPDENYVDIVNHEYSRIVRVFGLRPESIAMSKLISYALNHIGSMAAEILTLRKEVEEKKQAGI